MDKIYGKRYYNKDIVKSRKHYKEKAKIKIENVEDWYVKQKLAIKYKIKHKDVPQWMIEIKRPIIELRRKIRELKGIK